MSEPAKDNEGFVFTVVEEKGDEVIIEVSAEDYEREKAAGVEEEFLLKPGRHKFIRGGFRKRHPDFKRSDLDDPRNTKVIVSLPLDLDVFKYFEQRTKELKADSYQTLMNDALREVMERATKASPPPTPDYSALLKNKQFIKAVAERVKALSSPRRKRKRSAKAKAA